jgi:hypothetical protein
MLPEALASRDDRRQQAPAQVLSDLRGKGLCARSLATDLIFGSFHQGKEQSPPAIERDDLQNLEETKLYALKA